MHAPKRWPRARNVSAFSWKARATTPSSSSIPGIEIIYWSAGAERVFGWSAEEAIGESGALIFTPEDRAIGREQKELEIALREGCANDRRWHLRKDGSRIWVDGIMRRLDDEEGNLRGFAKVARDATEQRLADDELKKSREELEERVKERTAQLSAINQNLEKEITERSASRAGNPPHQRARETPHRPGFARQPLPGIGRDRLPARITRAEDEEKLSRGGKDLFRVRAER